MSRNDYRVTVKVRNNNILKAAESKGLSIPQVAAGAGVSYGDLNNLVNMTSSPFYKDGRLRPMVENVCLFLEASFDDLFSTDQCEALATNKSEKEVNAEQIYLMRESLSPSQFIDHDDGMKTAMLGALEYLTPTEKKVLDMRFGIDCDPMTLAEVGDAMGVCQERIRQIEKKALRKMRQPQVAKPLRVFLNVEE